MTSRIAKLSKLIFSLALTTGLLCAGTDASAQTTASITIPFAFSADNQYVAAGTYHVQLLSDSFLSLRNIATNQTKILMVRPEVGLAIETRGRFTFVQEGPRKYLAQVWIAGTSLHSEMALQHKAQHEHELRRSNATPPTNVEVALKYA